MGMKEYQPQRAYWDTVKGIGIFFVVMGHSCLWSQHYVYLYHLQLFYFVSGFLYSEKKYGDAPWLHVQNRLRTSWKTYVLVYIVVILLRNVFVTLDMLPLSYEPYTLSDTVIKISYAVFGSGDEIMAGPLWFIPVLVMAVVLLGFIVTASRRIEEQTHSAILKFAFQGISVLFFTVLGYPFVQRGIKLCANMDFSFLVLPYLWAGYLLRNYYGDIRRLLKPLPGVICAVLLFFISRVRWVDFTLGVVFPTMHLVGFLGIYMCLVLAHYLQKVRGIRTFVEYMGRNSMVVMVMHYPLLQIVDRLVMAASGVDSRGMYLTAPVAHGGLWPLYLIVGVGGSLAAAAVWNGILGRRKKD